MADVDTDWLNGAVAASLMPTTSCNIMWQFRLGPHLAMEMWAEYKLPDNLCIDSAYMTDKHAILLASDWAAWHVNFQYDNPARFGESWCGMS